MIFDRKRLNILLIGITVILGGIAMWLVTLPPPGVVTDKKRSVIEDDQFADSLVRNAASDALISAVAIDTSTYIPDSHSSVHSSPTDIITTSGFDDVDPEKMIADHPFRKEALKVLNNNLEESDSLNRRKILSYCEHFRTSYTTKDIDFLRQIFSDNALIIIGNVVKTGKKWNGTEDNKVSYAVRSKHSYLSRLDEIFRNNRSIKVDFSEFHIMRHPSMKGIYGVSLRQKYATDKYSDDGYIFLLWDFRKPSMPQIHVRTWQPHRVVADGEEQIDISDFNLD